jgi:hypothetical protein
VARFNTTLGTVGIGQQLLEHPPGYPHHTVVYADFNAELNSLPLGIPSGVIGKSEEHRHIGRAASIRIMFSICSTQAIQQ